MCGLLAHISLDGCPVDFDRFTSSLDLQKHRGPDDSGSYQHGNVTLGHRRLSIIDLSRSAAQPMHSTDKSISIIFNGEIYNFQELKSDLQKQGVSFNTKGDTEVLIHLYLKQGMSFLDRLNGMFAFVLYDKRTDDIYVVRDRLGIKPLYFHHGDDAIIVSSEIKSITGLKQRKSEINPIAVSSYFSFRFPILDDTFFDDVFSVPPGHYFKINNGEMVKNCYWNLAIKVSEQRIDRGEAYYLEKTLELLKSSVRYRQIADVKVGAYLSGGIDSSAIVALMTGSDGEKTHTFSIGFEEPGYNEFCYARSIAKQYQTDHHEIEMSGSEYVDLMTKLIYFKDAPLGVPNEVPLYKMSKELRKFFTVVLSGEGADEIFGGYGRIFQSTSEYEKLSRINNKTSHSDGEKAFLKQVEKKYGRTSFENQVDHFFAIYSYTSEELKSELLTEDVHNKNFTEKLKSKFSDCFNEIPDEPYLAKMMYAFEKLHLPGLLQRLDMTTMAASVEARVPFADHRLVEFAFTIPLKYKLKWSSKTVTEDDLLLSEAVSETHDIPKYILKKSLENHLENSILYRKKISFPVPLEKWFGGKMNGFAEDTLRKTDISKIVKLSKFYEILNDTNLDNNHALAMKVWMVVNLALFMDAHHLNLSVPDCD